MNNSIETFDLCKIYRRGSHSINAVDSLNITIEAGQLATVVGASGSGKSTLLNLIAGLDSPTDGKIKIGDKYLGDFNRKELSRYRAFKIGIIFQSFNLIPHFTALENVACGLMFQNVARKIRLERAEQILDKLGLGDRLDHKPADLSGGEQQRVATARALIKNPEILFADEPTGNLDEENSRHLIKLLTDLKNKGLTILMVTHDRAMAIGISDKIIRMHYGKVVEESEGAK